MQNTTHKYTPLRVRAYLQAPVAGSTAKYLPLDAVLYYHAVRRKFGDQAVSIPGQSMIPEGAVITLPLLKQNTKGSDWYYAASFAQWPDHTIEAVQHYAKRFDLSHSDLIDFKGKVGRVIIERGHYKAYYIKLYYRHALYVDWYVCGAKAEIEDLLRYCTHLGKDWNQGYGKVLRWEVQDWPVDWSCKGPEGRVMRALPLQTKQGTLYGIRPSYWLVKHQFQCVMPD